MFQATLTGEELDNVLTPITTIVDECRLQLNEDELATQAVDPANVAMIDFSVLGESFKDYDGDNTLAGIDLERLNDVSDMASSDDEVRLETTEDNRLHITINNQLDYYLNLLDPESIREEPDMPTLDPPASITLTGEQLNFGLKAADMVSDHVLFRADADDDVFVIEAKGDTDDVDYELEAGEVAEFDVEESVGSLFALGYLKDMVGAIGSSTEVTIYLGDELPVTLEYDIFDGDGSVRFMLAPRIEAE